MIPSQTLQVLLGTFGALLYAGAVLAVGFMVLMALLGRHGCTAACLHVGSGGFAWLGFVVGQGILGVVWLILSLAGILHASLVWIVCGLGWFLGCLTLLVLRRQVAESLRRIWFGLLAALFCRSWYSWVAVSLVIVGLLCGAFALLPPWSPDALNWYFVVPKMIAFSRKLEFQPFVTPHNGLYPLQVEMHWAALFAFSNETAVTVWDYICAVSFLSGIGYLSWALTSSRRVVLLAVLMMLSTPAFYELMGGGKVDNAAGQYGLAAFLWVLLWPELGQRAIILAGLCLGWTMAGRYTNVIVVPGLMVFAAMLASRFWKASPINAGIRSLMRLCVTNGLAAAIAAVVAGAPMLIKNWVLVGCPLAPQFGCQGTYWAAEYGTIHTSHQNISVVDLFFYPFVWTFGHRADMLGNISPLFLGFFPFLLAYSRFSIVRSAFIAGVAGFVSLVAWLLVEPLILYTRWLIVPLGLLVIPLSAAIIAAEQDIRHVQTARWLTRSAIFIVLLFLLFQTRGVAYTARYLAAVDSRAARYESFPYLGYDVATWLNTHVQPGQRVALSHWSGYRFLLSPSILLNSESMEELQWRWEHRLNFSSSDLWHFFAQHGFTYVVVPQDHLHRATSVSPNGFGLNVDFLGRNDAVVKIDG